MATAVDHHTLGIAQGFLELGKYFGDQSENFYAQDLIEPTVVRPRASPQAFRAGRL